ncbi:MAG: hypothetical protein IIZ35_06845, partial [Clostridia bacterium]|nr:hypothetical protein [Clostridia bacterium]
MIITGALILSGPYAPDPTYKNLYLYDVIDRPPLSPNAIPRAFFEDLRAPDGAFLYGFRYVMTFPENSSIYPIGETETGFTVELPTDDGFPERPQYIIVTDSTTGSPVYRYAFIEGYQRNGSQKIRCACRFDQWTEHFNEIATAEMSFARRHQKRYVNRTASPRYRIFNGLSDPVPEGMVQGTVKTDPLLVYGATLGTTSDATNHIIVPLWVYWRLSTSEFFYKAENAEDWSDARRLLGIDPPKFAVPILATCLGVIDYNPQTEVTAFRPTWKILKSDNTVLTDCAEDYVSGQSVDTERAAMVRAIATLGTGHPYIVQSWITTIPPFPVTVTYDSPSPGVPTVTRPIIKITDSRYNNVMTPGDGNEYKIGQTSEDVPAALTVQRGTVINLPFDTETHTPLPFP